MRGNEYETAEPYSKYLRFTNEKEKLAQELKLTCKKGEFPIQKNGKGCILDIGSGSGVNTFFLSDYFSNCKILGIEPSRAQYDSAISSLEASRKNVKFENVGIENFVLGENKFDFILISHVLQYLPEDVTVEFVVRKVCGMLKSDGQAWFVQHMRIGFAQIIFHMQSFLSLRNTRFQQWRTAEDFWLEISMLAKNLGCLVSEQQIDSSISGINFANPSVEDKERLKFMLLLDGSYDDEASEFKKRLAKLNLNRRDGRISHPNKIIKIRKT